MKRHLKYITAFKYVLWLFFIPITIHAQNVFRFGHLGTEQGLSQNTGSSILFDRKGFMWIGTMNGLNRYDGYEFKIYRGQSSNSENFTNNRVTRLWEDSRGFIWAETYDGYYHFFNPVSEVFSSIPDYKANYSRNFRLNTFLQYTDDIIFLGSSNGGIFILNYNAKENTYRVSEYPDKGNQALSNNSIRFIHADNKHNIWIGTAKGVNFVSAADFKNKRFTFQHEFVNASFTSVCEDNNEIWFGTEESGIILYNKNTGKFAVLNKSVQPDLPSDYISVLAYTKSGFHVAGFGGGKVMAVKNRKEDWLNVPFHGKLLNAVYEDRYQQLWLTAIEFGVTRFDVQSLQSSYYALTPERMKHLTDLERPQFYEDGRNNLWIGLHGGGLALYGRSEDKFQFFRNNPGDPNSISSNIVHSIAEDKTGQIWLGTGQFLGGIEKVIMENPAFRHILPEEKKTDMLDNVVRAIMEDRNGCVWVSTKAGRLHLYDHELNKILTLDSLKGIGNESVRNNIYAIFSDRNNYIWLGSKGDGISVSTKPVDHNTPYKAIQFKRYKFSETDTTSLGNNNIYSICQDSSYNIWIGTYGNGLSLLRKSGGHPFRFERINQQNSNLSSNLVRNCLVDRDGNLWVATTLGLNMLEKEKIDKGEYHFVTFFKDPGNTNSIGYNDIVQLFGDSKGRIWLGTFGSGADMIRINKDRSYNFTHFTSEDGLSNDVVFGILEDKSGYIWFSTENGITRLNPDTRKASIYNAYNGLTFNNFSENTCFTRRDLSLCFGGFQGMEVIYPENLVPEKDKPHLELTSFMLFNKEVPVKQSGSPLNKNISFTGSVVLKYNQSSFSINFSALEFLDPGKINFLYKLDNFDNEWNNVGNQHRATYTNIPPGKYVFRVKLFTSNDTSGSEERLLYIHIRPPWWKTIYAYFSYLLILIFLGTAIFKTASRLSRYRNELRVEKKVNELKLKFFTNVSHEIRTPLTLIVSPIEDILASKDISENDRTLMEIIHKNAKRMLHLTSQLLDFRKIQNNKMILRISKVDLIPFARQIFESFIPLAEHKEIQYTFYSSVESLEIHGDPSRLDIIIYNIISNAIKFTGHGKQVAVKILEQVDNAVDIEISDEGPGIPQKNLSDIFSRYTILSNRDFAGTGIGLSLSYELVKLHKGDILISSVEGKGSTFTIRLPKNKPDYGEAAVEADAGTLYKYNTDGPDMNGTEQSPDEEPGDKVYSESELTADQQPGDRPVILVVEDNVEILKYIKSAFRSSYNCLDAKNGEEGLQIAKSMNPDIIITDIMMPGMDGIEMTKRLKNNFETSHIPIIILTSKVDISDQIAGIETGAEAYILKPFNMEYLKAMTLNLLNQRLKIMARFTGKQELAVEPVKVASRDEEFLKKFVQYVENNYENDFSIDSLAEQCCVGRTVLYNKIKGLTGNSPLEFVRKVKMKIAYQLIEKGYNVSEVAYKTGFSDVKYFSRQYKALYGYPPSKQKLKI